MSPSQFFALLGPAAREDQKRTGIPAAVTLAQAALETEFGEHTIGSARNLFGIKGTGPAGSMRVPTREYGRRGAYTVNAGFRKYDSWTTSIGDHSKLLNGPIYRSAQKYKDDPDQFARAIKRCGYATDPHYASKLITLMRENNLYRWNC